MIGGKADRFQAIRGGTGKKGKRGGLSEQGVRKKARVTTEVTGGGGRWRILWRAGRLNAEGRAFQHYVSCYSRAAGKKK